MRNSEGDLRDRFLATSLVVRQSRLHYIGCSRRGFEIILGWLMIVFAEGLQAGLQQGDQKAHILFRRNRN